MMRASSVRASVHAFHTGGDQPGQDTPLGIPFNKGVRQPSIVRCAVPGPDEVGKHPAHPSNRLVAQLNESWRVIDDPLQWRLQRKKGNSREKNSGWLDRSFCTTREGLLRRVREYCDEAEPAALATLTALPQYHGMQNLDVRGADQAQADAPSEPLISQACGTSGGEG
jgi:hypothetical protein